MYKIISLCFKRVICKPLYLARNKPEVFIKVRTKPDSKNPAQFTTLARLVIRSTSVVVLQRLQKLSFC